MQYAAIAQATDKSWMDAKGLSSARHLNSYVKSQKVVVDHLLVSGMDKEYAGWIYHGE